MDNIERYAAIAEARRRGLFNAKSDDVSPMHLHLPPEIASTLTVPPVDFHADLHIDTAEFMEAVRESYAASQESVRRMAAATENGFAAVQRDMEDRDSDHTDILNAINRQNEAITSLTASVVELTKVIAQQKPPVVQSPKPSRRKIRFSDGREATIEES